MRDSNDGGVLLLCIIIILSLMGTCTRINDIEREVGDIHELLESRPAIECVLPQEE